MRSDARAPESAVSATLRGVLGALGVDPGEQASRYTSQALLLVAMLASVGGLYVCWRKQRRRAASAGARLAAKAPPAPRNLRRLRGKHTHAQLPMDDDADDDAAARPASKSQPQSRLSTKERFRALALAANGSPATRSCAAHNFDTGEDIEL